MSVVCLEHVAAATAALNQPGGGRAGLWQSEPFLAMAAEARNHRGAGTFGTITLAA
jgi:hypothetical protein